MTCSFDSTNIAIGSKICTVCTTGLTWSPTLLACTDCGNGKLEKNETCDDGGLGGCLPDCSGADLNYTCSGGSLSSPSNCVCDNGFSLISPNCMPICGDGKVVGNEVYDDGNLGGVNPTCSGANPNYTCSGGSPILASTCSCIPGDSKNGLLCQVQCGDGLVAATEGCDDGGLGGCLPNCSGPNNNFTCSAGSLTSPSVCSCDPGFHFNTPLCLT